MTTKVWRKVSARLQFAAPHIEGFSNWLQDKSYAARSIRNLVNLLAGWTDWAANRGFGMDSIDEGLVASQSFVKNRPRGRRAGDIHEASVGAGRLFVRYLRETAVLPELPESPRALDRWPRLQEFHGWMRQHRGVAESSLDLWQRHLIKLLETLGEDADAYSAAAIRAFVLARAKSGGRARARTITCAVRAYLRFLVAQGHCPPGREHAVPKFAQWRLSSVPKYLSGEDIDRVIAACEAPSRLRDRAIVLLLARLGLRSSDVAHLRLADIDWRHGRLAVSGKSRRAQYLPLTQEIGDAILTYLKHGRPAVRVPYLFVTDLAPRRPITRVTVRCLVRRTLLRAGVECPSKGAHVLRHSAATAMLRSGVSLAGVGAVLRHQSPATTLLYAKVGLPMLSEIAQPWAGRLPC